MDIHAFQLAGAALALLSLGYLAVCGLVAHRFARHQCPGRAGSAAALARPAQGAPFDGPHLARRAVEQ